MESSEQVNRETAEEQEEKGGSSEPGVVATPEGTAEVDEELEDRGDK
jgi:hypothetical protein